MFLVEGGALIIVASTIVPVPTLIPWRSKYACTLEELLSKRMRLQQMAEAAHRGLIGHGISPRSIPANRRIDTESYSASSTPGSERLNHCCTK